MEYPNWVVAQRDHASNNVLTLENDTGSYQMKSSEGLPVRFDKLVLYFLIHKLFQNPDPKFQDLEIVTTRYEIAKNVLMQEKNFSKEKYERIMLALRRWKAIYIKFDGVFYEGDNMTIKYFSILDYVSLDKTTNQLSVKFNSQYIRQLQETKFYKLINFFEYRKLTRPVSVRLYELVVKNFITQKIWCIDSKELGEQLTLEKRAYPSQIMGALKGAIEEINANTEYRIVCEYDKKKAFFIFQKQ